MERAMKTLSETDMESTLSFGSDQLLYEIKE